MKKTTLEIHHLDNDKKSPVNQMEKYIDQHGKITQRSLKHTTDKSVYNKKILMAMRDQTNRQFRQLYEQMQLLIEQTDHLKYRIEVSEKIYFTILPFTPVVGEIYYLYTRNDEKSVVSLLGPDEWKRGCPYASFEAELKLLSDYTWQVLKAENPMYGSLLQYSEE